MLESMLVKNLALIEEENVEFKSGLNILTGETGAGKSIIIGSINIALGAKAGTDIIRKGAKEAYIELVFDIDSDTIKNLQEYDIADIEDGKIIISRKISDGRSVSKINGETVTISTLKKISQYLIDIHGQHDHQSLLYPSKHLTLLDDYLYSELSQVKNSLKTAYLKYIKLKDEFKKYDLDEDERLRELSFINYEINELSEANLTLGEDEVLEEEFKRLNNSQKIIDNVNNALNLINSEISDKISLSYKAINSIIEYDNDLSNVNNELADLESLSFDISRELESYINHFDYDEERYYNISERINLLNKLKQKYGDSIDKCIARLEYDQNRLEELNTYDELREKNSHDLDLQTQEVLSLCGKLSNLRKEGAIKLKEEITAALIDLNFNDVRFDISFKESKNFSENGYDDIEFLISTNPGEELKPISQVASGGELSRIMLALKSINASKDGIDTLIFDEIDTGISGITAARVANKMKLISNERQIIAITHLAQIASVADVHYLIKKEVRNNQTFTSISELSYDNSIYELGRILGGDNITEAILKSAKEMKEKS